MFLVGILPARADTNLLSSGKWMIDGETNAAGIRITIGKTAVTVSELKFFYNFGGTNVVQVLAVTADGTFQPALPAGEAGGAFQLGSYQDCALGLVGPLVVTDLVLPAKVPRNGVLHLTGALANGNSLRGDRLLLTVYPPTTNAVRVDVQCRLVATRDFCVDQSGATEQDKFRVVTMAANYTSPADYDNDLARYIWLAEKDCFGWYGCYTRYKSECISVTNQLPGYLINKPRSLGKPWLMLAHTTATPRVTPSLQVAFRSPAGIKPQGFWEVPAIELWGNWTGVKKSYKAKQGVARLNCTLEATPPRSVSCEELQR